MSTVRMSWIFYAFDFELIIFSWVFETSDIGRVFVTTIFSHTTSHRSWIMYDSGRIKSEVAVNIKTH